MVSLFRLKGRALQIDNYFIMLLTFLTGLFLLVSVNLLPVIYESTVGYFFYNDRALFSYVSLFASVFFLLTAYGFYSCVRLGAKRYLLRKAQKKNPSARDIFFYFSPKGYFSAFFYSVKITLIKLLIFIFCFLPAAVCAVMLYRFSQHNVSALVCVSFAVTALCLSVNGGIFYSLFYSSFFLCDYYFIDGSYVSFRHLMACSQRNMRRRNTLLTKLKISFVGWFALCLALMPIPYVWGYYNQSLAVAAAEFMREKAD